jgi:hypothetical protein
MKTILSLCLGLFCVLAAANFSSVQAQTATAEVWTVTVDVFSGMPNPAFTLTASEITEVRARLSAAPQLRAMTNPKETILPARLGYRGMMVSAVASGKQIEKCEVAAGKILRRLAGVVHNGKAAGLEGYLLSLAVAKGVVTPDLADEIKVQSRGSIP